MVITPITVKHAGRSPVNMEVGLLVIGELGSAGDPTQCSSLTFQSDTCSVIQYNLAFPFWARIF